MSKENLTTFLIENNPQKQNELAKHPYECMFGNYPTMRQLRKEMGENAPVMWLTAQLKDLSEYCGCSNKLTPQALHNCANIIATQYGYLMTSELMLFFFHFKAGRYGEFYGAVDPIKITSSLRKFLLERNDYFFRLEQKRKEREKEESMKDAVTYEEYRQMVERGEI